MTIKTNMASVMPARCPVSCAVTAALKVGKPPIGLQLGSRYYAEGPSGGPEWGLRFAITLLFPK
jgi:hypothetical protein